MPHPEPLAQRPGPRAAFCQGHGDGAEQLLRLHPPLRRGREVGAGERVRREVPPPGGGRGEDPGGLAGVCDTLRLRRAVGRRVLGAVVRGP